MNYRGLKMRLRSLLHLAHSGGSVKQSSAVTAKLVRTNTTFDHPMLVLFEEFAMCGYQFRLRNGRRRKYNSGDKTFRVHDTGLSYRACEPTMNTERF
jgi:hypothetical protein